MVAVTVLSIVTHDAAAFARMANWAMVVSLYPTEVPA